MRLHPPRPPPTSAHFNHTTTNRCLHGCGIQSTSHSPPCRTWACQDYKAGKVLSEQEQMMKKHQAEFGRIVKEYGLDKGSKVFTT